MTIYKTQAQDKKDKSPEDPDVVREPLTGGDSHSTDAHAAKCVRVTYGPRNNRAYINLCLIVAALIVLGAGIIGAICLYRHLSHRVTRGVCGVTYYDEVYHRQDMLTGQEPISIDLTHDDNIGFRLDFFEERVEVSDIDGYERIQVPRFDECEETVVWHDFRQNYTAIVDHPHNSCFVMKLNRTLVAPPREVSEMLDRLEHGDYYFPRADVVREKYAIVTPAMTDLKVLGPYIMRECFWYDTFALEKIVSGVYKRSVDVPQEKTVGFSNLKDMLIKLTILMPETH